MLRIKRNTGISGALFRINVYVNGQQVTKIKRNQQIEFELPADKATISVSQVGARSNELVVKEGQVVEITTSSWWYISFISFVVAMFFLGLLLPFDYRIFGYLLMIAIAFAIDYFIPWLNLKIVYP